MELQPCARAYTGMSSQGLYESWLGPTWNDCLGPGGQLTPAIQALRKLKLLITLGQGQVWLQRETLTQRKKQNRTNLSPGPSPYLPQFSCPCQTSLSFLETKSHCDVQAGT